MENQVAAVVVLLITLAALIAAIVIGIVVLRRSEGITTTKKSKVADKMPDDEHKGRDGIIRMLSRYAALHEYQVVNPANLTGVHGTTDLDVLLVGWFGILGVKCLGYGGTIYGDPSEEQWVQELQGHRRTFQNPMTRAQKSGLVIRDVLFAAGMKRIPVETVVVFTNKSAQLMLPRSNNHYTEKTFAAYLKTLHFEEDKNVQVDPVAKLMRENSAK